MPDIRKQEKSMFEYRNSVSLCGRIVFKRPVKNGNLFALSISRRTGRTDENGRQEKAFRMVDVLFEGAAGKQYDKEYEAGDFVAIGGVVQKTRNFRLARDMVKVIGISMAPKVSGNREIPDSDTVTLRGKIVRASAVNDDLVIVNVYTNVHKEFRNPVPGSEVEVFSDDFISETPVAIWRTKEGEHDAKALLSELTKGTWLDISGYIDTRKIKLKEGDRITEQRVVSRNVSVVGEIQPLEKETVARLGEKIIIPLNKAEEGA